MVFGILNTMKPSTTSPVSDHAKVGLGLLGMLAMLGMLTTLTETVLRGNPSMVAEVVRSVIVNTTNTNRTEHGAGLLTINPQLTLAAQRKAQDMAQKGYFAHVSPEGVTPWSWFSGTGYRFTHAGENLAVRFSDSETIVRAWMNSDGHRANLLNPDFTEIGIGIAEGEYKGKKAIFVVQLFGTPVGGR